MLVLGAVVIGASEVDRATEFWTEALGLRASDPQGDAQYTLLTDADGKASLAIARSGDQAPRDPRVFVDLVARDGQDQTAEVERLIGLGAERVDRDAFPAEGNYALLSDTEGNLFRIVNNMAAPGAITLDMPD